MKYFSILYAVCFALFSGLANPASTQAPPTPSNATLPLKELRLFTHVFDHVRRGYVDEVSDSELLLSAIEGMLYKLDPYSRYLDQQAYRQLREMTSGNYGGIGVEVATEDGMIRIISPLDQTPAARAGILAGDLIVAIDGASLRELPPSRAAEKLRGPTGSAVELTLMRSNREQPLNITLTRDLINIDTLHHRLLDHGIGYVLSLIHI